MRDIAEKTSGHEPETPEGMLDLLLPKAIRKIDKLMVKGKSDHSVQLSAAKLIIDKRIATRQRLEVEDLSARANMDEVIREQTTQAIENYIKVFELQIEKMKQVLEDRSRAESEEAVETLQIEEKAITHVKVTAKVG